MLGERIRSRWGRRAYWLQAELVAMATDLAEVIGGAVALNLLFGLPLLWGGVITGTVSLVLLVHPVPARRRARSSSSSSALLAIIAIGFTVGVFVAPPDAGGVVGGLVPRFDGRGLGAARGVHPRRHDHAARDLRALRAHPRPFGAMRRRPASVEPARGILRAHARAGTSRSPWSSPAP